jgi:hypothetical protein
LGKPVALHLLHSCIFFWSGLDASACDIVDIVKIILQNIIIICETPLGEGEGEGDTQDEDISVWNSLQEIWSVMYFSSTLLTNRVYIQIFANTQPSTVPSTSSIVPQPQPTQQTLHLVNLYQFL